MRNILLTNFVSQKCNYINCCQTFCYDSGTLYAYGNGILVKCENDSETVIFNFKDFINCRNEVDNAPSAIKISYCCEKDLLYLILQNGDIISLEPSGTSKGRFEGSVEGGIKAAEWSPEQELIALINGCNNVIVMTNDFYPVSEVHLHGGGFGEKQIVTVGWGKKETQFRGSEGKFNSANVEKEVSIEQNENIEVSWRGDAEYFVVSSLNPDTQSRYFRIFSKNGVLQYTSENLSGVESCLDWRPSGNLIAGVQRFPNKYVVCFFEKNGLKHGDFPLPFNHNQINVKKVLWSKDSKILTLFISKCIESRSEDNLTVVPAKESQYIQLYSVSNYHWYCKFTINFDHEETPLCIQWDHQKFNTLHVIVKRNNNVHHNKYSWIWVTNKSRGSKEDKSYVAVIDGYKVQLTSFNEGIIPPPLSTYDLKFESPVNSVSFSPSGNDLNSNDLLVLLADGTLEVFKYFEPYDASNKISHKLIGKVKNIGSFSSVICNIQWVEYKKFVLSVVQIGENLSKPLLYILEVEGFDISSKYQVMEVPLESTAALIKVFKSSAIIYSNNENLYLFNFQINMLEHLFSNNNKFIQDLEVIEKDNEIVVLSLDISNKFSMNNKVMFQNILSFLVHDNFVLLTNMKHELLCINIFHDISDIDQGSKIFKRKIERGSKLVTSIHKDMKVILQMPRGNLECIQPRALSIHALGKYLDSLNYFDAFNLMRKQRISLNLLYDHNPFLFSKNIDTFIQQIVDPQWISLFISDLIEEDVTETMYSVEYKKNSNENVRKIKSKVDTICEIVEKAISSLQNSEKYLLPLLTCYIKREKIEYLEMALLKIKHLKEKELKGFKPSVSFNEALKYVLYLIDVEELYKIALGMYDFDLVMLIASKSQRDPKEYIPFLNDLKKLDSNYQKFAIDKYLKRYEKALKNLLQCDGETINECINFIKTHQLHRLALKMIPQNTDMYKNVCSSYGEELFKSQSFEESGIMFTNAGLYSNAIDAFKKSGNWQEALNCARELKLEENELSELYIDLAIDLIELKQYDKAAIIYLDYIKDVEECVKTLTNGKYFGEAYRICYLHNQSYLISKHIVKAILEHGNLIKDQISNFHETFDKQLQRLKIVRKIKMEENQIKPECDLDSDLFSETSTILTKSVTSRTTTKTYRSAKNKRKHERKLLSLKEGSPYEDLALVTSLYHLITNCEALKSEVKELNKFLVKINELELAEKVQRDLQALVKKIEESKSEIWISELLSTKQSYEPDVTSDMTSIYSKLENTGPTLLNPKFAIPPETQNNFKWTLEILKQ